MRYLIGLSLLLPMAVFAKDPPLPEALLNAKTAFVEMPVSYRTYLYCSHDIRTLEADGNVTWCKSYLELYGPKNKRYAKSIEALKKWGRFSLVEEQSKADVIILLKISPQSISLADLESIQRSNSSKAPSINIGGHYPTANGNVESTNPRDHVTSTDANGKRYSTDMVSGTHEIVNRSQTGTTTSGISPRFFAGSLMVYGGKSKELLFSYYSNTDDPVNLVSKLKKRLDREQRAKRSQ